MPIVMEKEASWRGDRYRRVFMLQENLVEHTGDLKYQAHMIEDFPQYVDYLKALVIDSIGRTPVNAGSVNFFQRVILTETDPDAVARATRRLLAAMKISRGTIVENDIYNKLEGELRSDDIQAKLRIFAKMDQRGSDCF